MFFGVINMARLECVWRKSCPVQTSSASSLFFLVYLFPLFCLLVPLGSLTFLCIYGHDIEGHGELRVLRLSLFKFNLPRPKRHYCWFMVPKSYSKDIYNSFMVRFWYKLKS